MKSPVRWFAPLLMLLTVPGCGREVPRSPALLAVPAGDIPNGFWAGVAEGDITPPLHLSLFGHGPESRVATGVRLRLRCQAFVISSSDGPIALVPCDLQSSSSALQRKVAEYLQGVGVPITADRIYVMATHTHAAPAHYFEARHYSGPFSASLPGYDEKVVEFLARRISDAIVRAFAKLSPVCIGWNSKPDLWGLTFNRSYVPFLSNGDPQVDEARRAEHEYTANQSQQAPSPAPTVPSSAPAVPSSAPSAPSAVPAAGSSAPPTGPEAAVDPSLFVMRIDARDRGTTTCQTKQQPLGVFAVFGMHPTGIPNTNELYHGDIFGFATRTAGACLHRAAALPDADAKSAQLAWQGSDELACDDTGVSPARGGVVVGLANGIEGDVSPKLEIQSVPAARRLGRRLGIEIARAAARIDTLSAAGPATRAYWELWFPGARYDNNPGNLLCEQGELGMSLAGGAHDGPTRLRVLPEANAGYRLTERAGCHGYKLPVRFGTSPSKYDYPRFGAISLLKIGDAVLATLPAELTTVAGTRIRRALRARLSPEFLPIVGLTNQYFQYVTTESEYEFQRYEGASTLYGPKSSQFFVWHFDCLAEWLKTGKADAPPPERCSGQKQVNALWPFERSPAPEIARILPEEECEPLLLENPKAARTTADGDWGWEIIFPRMPLHFTSDRALFRVEILEGKTGTQVVDDDDGSAVEVQETEAGESWRVRWTPDLEGARAAWCKQWFRIAIRGNFSLESMPFQVTCPKASEGAP